MKTHTFGKLLATATAIFLCMVDNGRAAPSTELEAEIITYLESSDGFAIVDKENGQIRIQQEKNNTLFSSEPDLTNIHNITGIASGLFTETQGEALVLASLQNNIFAKHSIKSNEQLNIHPINAGPQFSIPFQKDGSKETFLTHSKYGSGSETMELWIVSSDETPEPIDIFEIDGELTQLQPLQERASGDRHALFLTRDDDQDESGTLFFLSADDQISNPKAIAKVQANATLISEAIGEDGRTCVITFEKKATAALITTVGFDGFDLQTVKSNNFPFQIGSITALPAKKSGDPRGILITAFDGSTAAHAEIENGEKFSIVETFTSSPGKKITGLAPLLNGNFAMLETSPLGSRSTDWKLYQNTGGSWNQVSNGSLPSLINLSTDFATLFWFNGTPLIDPTAELVEMETRADWTRKVGNGNIPAQVTLASFSSNSGGLTNSGNTVTTPPSGSTFLITNQYAENISITALDSIQAVSKPTLEITPSSGTYQTSISINATFDETAFDVFYREDTPGSSWRPFENLTIGYPSTWLFYTKNKTTGASGPIVTRTYSFPKNILNELDSDDDGVPDYVERHFGLDPSAGADSDGDLQSDLEEILSGTDPNNRNSKSTAANRIPGFSGEGFKLYVQAFNATTGQASPKNNFATTTTEDDQPGELISMHTMFGNLIGREHVEFFPPDHILSGDYGATLEANTPVPARELIVLSTPKFFNLGTGSNPLRNGRETYKVLARPINNTPAINTSPTGNTRASDAINWVNAVQAAYANFDPVTGLMEIRPYDNATSALIEYALYSALDSLNTPMNTVVEIPTTRDGFTLFPYRDGENAKEPFNETMNTALRDAGYDLRKLAALIENGVATSPFIRDLANAIYKRHSDTSNSIPLMAMPLDALRSVLLTGSITDPAIGNTARENPYASISSDIVNEGKMAMDALLSNLSDAIRPIEQWNLVIEPSTTPLHNYDYRRESNRALAYLVDDFGERVLLEQGLGLPLGAIFTVRGYVDTAGPSGFDTMEVLNIITVVTPVASDTDTNANLLDDDWERFFFGDLGIINPLDPHPITGHTYLQYHTEGADPREGELNSSIATMLPSDVQIIWNPNESAYDISFKFPREFVSAFSFDLDISSSLTGFAGPVQVGEMQDNMDGSYTLKASSDDSNMSKNFFRISMSLK